MKFSSLNGKIEDPEVTADYESAGQYEKTRVGKLGVYYPSGFGVRYIPYNEVEQAFIRVQEVNGRMCCGKAVFHYFRLVLRHGGKEITDIMSENEKLMDDALAAIAKNAPQLKIGV